MPAVMVSYARADAKDFAGRLISELKHHAVDAWLDTSDIEGGADWLREIKGAILGCQVFIPVRTPQAKESFWVRSERLMALNHRGKHNCPMILPVIPIDCPEDDLELISFQPVDFRHNFEAAFSQLLKHLEALRDGKPAPAVDVRQLERAYLGKVILEYSVWQDRYTPMAGVAQFHAEQEQPQMQTQPTFIDPVFAASWHGDGKQAEAPLERRDYTDILPAIRDLRQLVILGDPGSGKTTTLWRIAVEYAQRADADPSQPIPVVVRLGELEGDESIETHIRHQLGELSPHYDHLLAEKRLAFLLDGLNEMPSDHKAERVAALRKLVSLCQQQDMVVAVTCRELDYTPTVDMGIDERVEVKPLDPLRIREFANRYLTETGKGDDLFWQLAGAQAQGYWTGFQKKVGETAEVFWLADQLPRGKQWGFGNWHWDRWIRVRGQPRSMLSLATNPYMLFMMTQVFALEGELPQNRGALFGRFVDFLLLKREKMTAEKAAALKHKLSLMGYAMQAQGVGTSLPRAEVLAKYLSADDLYAAQSANLLTGGDDIRFSHQLLQEYFAALSLDNARGAGTHASAFWKSQEWWEPTAWEETAILLAGLYSDDCTPVIDWLKEIQPALAARCLLESGAKFPQPTWLSLRDTCLPRMIDPQREPEPKARAALGRALGRLDYDNYHQKRGLPWLDNRKGVGILPSPPAPLPQGEGGAGSQGYLPQGEGGAGSQGYLPEGEGRSSEGGYLPSPSGRGVGGEGYLPDIDWVEIPAGEFIYQGGERLYLPTFSIARYPITYLQFQTFIDAEDGIRDDRWWVGLAEEYREPFEQYFKYANHPRENVNWYQAIAFCRWLSHRLSALTPRPPLPQASEGETWQLSAEMKYQMTEVARRLRREATGSEEKLWEALRNRALGGRKFRRQHLIGAFVLDFYCHQERLAVEVDGSIHQNQGEADAERQALIEGLGIRFVRFTAWEVEHNLSEVLKRIEAAFLPSPVAGEGPGVRAVYDPMNPFTWLVRLPTEQEWEKAARGTDGRIYPYGNKFDATKGNAYETDIWQTSAVGIFPQGASPYGVLEMSGNVWEWCLTEYEGRRSNNIANDNRRVLRGGSWIGYPDFARAAFRNHDDPDARHYNVGFRVARSY